MLKERDSLWVRILIAKYNDVVPINASSWWKDIHSTCFENDDGEWMEGDLCRKVGEGNEVKLWHDNWLGGGNLKEKFERLFNLSVQQNLTIREMGRWSNGSWDWEFIWQRLILDRDIGMVEDFLNIVSIHTLIEGSVDDWVWTKEGGGAYSVKSAFDMLQGMWWNL